MIQGLKIKNFKSISDEQDVKLKQFTAIVGNNGVGKSNLICAISLVKDLSRAISVGHAVQRFVMTSGELFNRNSSSNEFEITMKFKNGTEHVYEYKIIIALDRLATETSKLIIRHELLNLCGSQSCEVIFERNGDNLVNKDGVKIPLDLPSNISALSQYQHPDLKKIKSLLAKTFVSSLDISDLVEKVEKHIYNLTKKPAKYEQFMNLASDLLPSLKTFEKIDIVSDDPFSVEDEYMMLLTEKEMKGKLSLKAISHGDLRTLYFLAAGILSDDYSTFVFDEIENGIHPKRISKIIEFLNNISLSHDKQFIFSTHSTKIINSMRPQDVIYVHKDPIRGTIFKAMDTSGEIDAVSSVLEKGGELSEYIQAKS